MTKLSDSVASRIRELRSAKGWSQEKLAEESGLSRDAVSRIERGDRGPRLETLELIARAVGLTLPKLVDFGEPPPRSRARDDRMRSLQRSLDQVEPWLAQALIAAIRVIAQAQIRARGRKVLLEDGEPDGAALKKPSRRRQRG
jgi:transcriptional regulator with XRE-family HTH domain